MNCGSPDSLDLLTATIYSYRLPKTRITPYIAIFVSQYIM